MVLFVLLILDGIEVLVFIIPEYVLLSSNSLQMSLKFVLCILNGATLRKIDISFLSLHHLLQTIIKY